MTCKICNLRDEGEAVVICSYCVQNLLGYSKERADEILNEIEKQLAGEKVREVQRILMGKLYYISWFTGIRKNEYKKYKKHVA